MSVDIQKALVCGLRFRPLEETIRDTFEWQAALGSTPAPAISISAAPKPQAGMASEREAGLLKAWHEGRSTSRHET